MSGYRTHTPSIIGRVFQIGALLACTGLASGQSTWYVDDDAPNDPGPNNSTISDLLEDGSVSNPFDDIEKAMYVAAPGDEIRIAEGFYDAPTFNGIVLLSGMKLRGGFANFNPPNPDVQDPSVYLTVLSGAAHGSLHVIRADNSSASTLI
ncbi:MAG: hypothetical protein O7G85_08100, partial [Planctomycetota bacterium]|nr:hypothetical protein [Planctomycetota bacterium]